MIFTKLFTKDGELELRANEANTAHKTLDRTPQTQSTVRSGGVPMIARFVIHLTLGVC